jgi:hypothetical protein
VRWTEDNAEDKGVTAWHVAEPASKWFSPSEASFMINYRIDSAAEMIQQLSAGGIPIQKGREYHENGVFLWVIDPDGNKVELWEPKSFDPKNKK